MSDLFDTSRIPDDPEHWDGLAARVAEQAMREVDESALEWVGGSRGGLIGASLLVAAAVVLAMLPGETTSPAPETVSWASALAPADDVGRNMMAADRPPEVGYLLVGAIGGGK